MERRTNTGEANTKNSKLNILCLMIVSLSANASTQKNLYFPPLSYEQDVNEMEVSSWWVAYNSHENPSLRIDNADINEATYAGVASLLNSLDSNSLITHADGLKNDSRKDRPLAPSSLRANALSFDSIRIDWQDNANNETGFIIERSTDSGHWLPIASVDLNRQSYTNNRLTANQRYHYRLQAYNASGDSSYSNQANAKLNPP